MQRIAVGFCLGLAVLAFPSPSVAQDAPSNGWIDVNFLGVKSQQDEQTATFTRTLFRETARVSAVYPEIEGTGEAIEIGGGFRFGAGRSMGVGVHFDAANIEQIAGLAATIPHPTLFGRSATGTGFSGVLERQDRAIDIQAIYFAPTPAAWLVRIFGGPTYFNLKEERVSIVNYQQVFNAIGANIITITSPTVAEVDGSGWGFNIGGDVGFFFSRYVGVGGTVRFNRGTVTLDDPLSGVEADREAGHISFGGGLRLRF